MLLVLKVASLYTYYIMYFTSSWTPWSYSYSKISCYNISFHLPLAYLMYQWIGWDQNTMHSRMQEPLRLPSKGMNGMLVPILLNLVYLVVKVRHYMTTGAVATSACWINGDNAWVDWVTTIVDSRNLRGDQPALLVCNISATRRETWWFMIEVINMLHNVSTKNTNMADLKSAMIDLCNCTWFIKWCTSYLSAWCSCLQKQLVSFLGHLVFFLIVGRSITLAVRTIVVVFAVIAIFILFLPLFGPILAETALVLAVLMVAFGWIWGNFLNFWQGYCHCPRFCCFCAAFYLHHNSSPLYCLQECTDLPVIIILVIIVILVIIALLVTFFRAFSWEVLRIYRVG